MAIDTTQISSETNLSGVLINSQLTSSGLTVYARFTDNKTGVLRTPQATTKLFTINKDNSKAETILADSHSTTDGVTTITINAAGRNIPKYGTGAGSATGNTHDVGSSIGCVDIARNLNMLTSEVVAKAALKTGDTFTGPVSFSGATTTFRLPNLTTTERDALTPANGMKIYNTTAGEEQVYNGGTWYAVAAGSTQPNASETVAGKVEQATLAEQGAQTEIGATGAPLFLNPKNTVKTGTGSDENKVPLMSLYGLDLGLTTSIKSFTFGENIDGTTTPLAVYLKSSDNKVYKTTTAGAEATFQFIGFVRDSVLSSAIGNVIVSGIVGGFTGLTAGSTYNLNGTAGEINTTQPTTGFVYNVAKAISTTQLVIDKGTKYTSGFSTLATTGASNTTITLDCGFKPVKMVMDVKLTAPSSNIIGYTLFIHGTTLVAVTQKQVNTTLYFNPRAVAGVLPMTATDTTNSITVNISGHTQTTFTLSRVGAGSSQVTHEISWEAFA